MEALFNLLKQQYGEDSTYVIYVYGLTFTSLFSFLLFALPICFAIYMDFGFNKYIQKKRPPIEETFWRGLAWALINHICLFFSLKLLYPFMEPILHSKYLLMRWNEPLYREYPSVVMFIIYVVQIYACIYVEDFLFYFLHKVGRFVPLYL